MTNRKPIDIRKLRLAAKLSMLLENWPKDPLSAEVLAHVKKRTTAVLDEVKKRKG